MTAPIPLIATRLSPVAYIGLEVDQDSFIGVLFEAPGRVGVVGR